MQPARLQNLRQSMGDDRQSHHHSQSQNNNNPFNQTHQSMQLSLKPGSTTHAFMLHKRMSQERVPSKQGRMFHIELGQNEGPFKKNEIIGQPHIDKFGSTQSMNSTIGGQNSQMHGASQISPRIGILGHHQYKAEDRAQIMLADEATNSISQQIRRIEDSLVQGYELLNTYKSESENLRSQVDHLMTQLIEKNEGVLQEIHPDLIDDYKTLKDTIKEQKDENEQLYKLLLNLKKETASSSQKLQLCQNRIARLENNLGVNTLKKYKISIGQIPYVYFLLQILFLLNTIKIQIKNYSKLKINYQFQEKNILHLSVQQNYCKLYNLIFAYEYQSVKSEQQ